MAAASGVVQGSPRVLPASVRHGVAVTIAFFLLYYFFLFGQGNMKRKLRRHYEQRGKKFDRYSGRDPKMLAWDRTAGNMLEQAVPFLALFWLNIWMSSFESRGMSYGYVVASGWLYVVLRSVYPVLWFSGAGDSRGNNSLIWKVTMPMYSIIAIFAINAAVVATSAS